MPTRAAIKRRMGKSRNPFHEVNKALDEPKKEKNLKPIAHRIDLNTPGTSREAAMRAAMRKQIADKSRFQRSSTNKGRKR